MMRRPGAGHLRRLCSGLTVWSIQHLAVGLPMSHPDIHPAEFRRNSGPAYLVVGKRNGAGRNCSQVHPAEESFAHVVPSITIEIVVIIQLSGKPLKIFNWESSTDKTWIGYKLVTMQLYGFTTSRPRRSNRSKSRSRCGRECPASRQKVAIKQSMFCAPYSLEHAETGSSWRRPQLIRLRQYRRPGNSRDPATLA